MCLGFGGVCFWVCLLGVFLFVFVFVFVFNGFFNRERVRVYYKYIS